MDNLYFQWHITDICNFRCRHCYQDKFDSAAELDIKGLKSVSDRIIEEANSQSRKAVINVTGGEPFLKKDLFELLDYLNSREETAELIIITNGGLINNQLIKKLRKIKKIKQIKVSLEGADSISNDSIRGRGAFDKATKAVKLLKESGLSVIIMFTAMKSNIKEINGLYELCRNLNTDGFIVERFFPMGEGSKIKDELLDSRGWFNLVKALFELSGESFVEDEILPWRGLWIRFSDTKQELLGASCNVGTDAFCIMPNADVYPCRRFNLRLGNLLESPLSEIINSQALAGIINGRRRGRCAECDIADCRGCPALSYLLTGDYLASDFQCWHKH